MKTISKILGVVLCLTMVLGLFAVGTSATSPNPSATEADFNTIVTANANGNSSYAGPYTTTNGWTVENSAIQCGGTKDSNPQYMVVGPDNTHKAVCLNGKVSAPGKVTSPTLTGGISKLTIVYIKMFTDTKLGAKITITDKTTGTAYTDTLSKEADKNDKGTKWTYEWTLDTPITGDFTIEVLNTSPTANTGNKDRLTILNLSWTPAGGSVTPPPATENTTPSTEATTPSTEATTPSTGNTVTDGSKIVIYNPNDAKYVTGTEYLYTSKSGSTKTELKLTTDKASALVLTVKVGSNGNISFVTNDGKYLYCNGTDVKLVAAADENTEFVLEGSYIRCANATFSGKAQYLEVYSGYLTCYGMGTNTALYTFELQAAPTEPSVEPSEPSTEATTPSTEATTPSTEATTPATKPSTTLAPVAKPVAGTGYKFALVQAKLGKTLYFTGKMDGNFYATSENAADAVDVYLEATEGGYYFYFMDGTTKTYLSLEGYLKNGSQRASVKLTTEATTVFTYSADAKTFVSVVGTDTFYLGTYNDFTTMSASSISYITGDKAANVGVSQYVSTFYAPAGGSSNTGDASFISAAAAVLVLSVIGGTALIIKKKEN